MKRRNGFPGAAAAAMAGILVLASCRTLPVEPFPPILGWLPEESDIVIRVKVAGNEELIDGLLAVVGLDPTEFSAVRRRTALLGVGLERDESWDPDSVPQPGETPIPTFHLAALGKWPRGVLGGALGSEWTPEEGRQYTWSGPDSLVISAPSKQDLLLSSGRMDEMMERRRTSAASPLADEEDEYLRKVDAAVWVKDPLSLIAPGTPLPLVEVRDMRLYLISDEKGAYFTSVVLRPADPSVAGSLGLTLRLALATRFGLSPDPEMRELLAGLSVEVVEGEVRLLTPPLSRTLLLSMVGDLIPGGSP